MRKIFLREFFKTPRKNKYIDYLNRKINVAKTIIKYGKRSLIKKRIVKEKKSSKVKFAFASTKLKKFSLLYISINYIFEK